MKPVSYRRLSDLVAVGLLTKVFPPAMVDEVIEQAGRREQRSRSLPARMMAYFAIGMGLYSEGSYEEVMSQVADGLSWVSGRQGEFDAAVEVGDISGACPLGDGAVASLVRQGRRTVRDAEYRGWAARWKAAGGDGQHLPEPPGHPTQRGLLGPAPAEHE